VFQALKIGHHIVKFRYSYSTVKFKFFTDSESFILISEQLIRLRRARRVQHPYRAQPVLPCQRPTRGRSRRQQHWLQSQSPRNHQAPLAVDQKGDSGEGRKLEEEADEKGRRSSFDLSGRQKKSFHDFGGSQKERFLSEACCWCVRRCFSFLLWKPLKITYLKLKRRAKANITLRSNLKPRGSRSMPDKYYRMKNFD